VLNEIVPSEEQWMPSLRFSFSIFNTVDEIAYTVKILADFVNEA
jgi:cysteine desulfurase